MNHVDFTRDLVATLTLNQVAEKLAAVNRLWHQRHQWSPPTAAVPRVALTPGYPVGLRLLPPQQVPQRHLSTREGRVALLHAVAHIEFNAIHLALDAIYRFPDMPPQFYGDWFDVAADEARHFALLQTRLQALDSAYGALPAHNGLWDAAEKTAHDVLVRMALVPRVLEARGLDVTPGMIARLQQVGDLDTVAILHTILREEVRHVAIGSHWFAFCCEQRQLDPRATFRQLLREYRMAVRPPLNTVARLQSGFSADELADLLADGQSLRG